MKPTRQVLASVALMLCTSSVALAIPLDVRFDVNGDAIGNGLFVLDSIVLAPRPPNTVFDTLQPPISNVFTSFDITLNIDSDPTALHYDLETYVYLALDIRFHSGLIDRLCIYAYAYAAESSLQCVGPMSFIFTDNPTGYTGTAFISNVTVTEHVATVPEPSIALLLASGLMVLGVVRRKSRV